MVPGRHRTTLGAWTQESPGAADRQRRRSGASNSGFTSTLDSRASGGLTAAANDTPTAPSPRRPACRANTRQVVPEVSEVENYLRDTLRAWSGTLAFASD